MAVDKKGDYYNPPSDYQDLDGNWKTFTYIDHDKHISRTQSGRETEEALLAKEARLKEAREALASYKESLIKEILALPACNVRKDNDGFMNQVMLEEVLIKSSSPMTWNEKIIREASAVNEDFLHLLHKRVLSFHSINNVED